MINESVWRLVLGDVEVIRVVDWQGPYIPSLDLLPGSTTELWKANEDWLAPDHWDPETDRTVVALQSWVLRSGGRTVVIDPGVGNGRERPASPRFHHWQGDFLGGLERAGVRREDVDVVVNTHLHGDHVGWNTTAVDGGWAPTFPNAEYLVPAADDAHFGPESGYANGLREDDRLIYEDSVAPIHRSGQAVRWHGAHRIDQNLTLESSPGHTPGSSVLRLTSGSDRAVFVGDLVHNPLQLIRPDCNSCLCHDPVRAAASRIRILERAASEKELVVPAHFGGAGAVEVRKEHGRFTLGAWAGTAVAVADLDSGPPRTAATSPSCISEVPC